MATVSELDKIRSNPTKDGLRTFRCLFKSTCADLSIATSSDAVQVVFSTAAVAGMARLLLPPKFLANVHSYQKPGARPYPSSSQRTSGSYPSFTVTLVYYTAAWMQAREISHQVSLSWSRLSRMNLTHRLGMTRIFGRRYLNSSRNQISQRLRLSSRILSSIRHFDPARLLGEGLSRRTTKSTSESSRNSQGASTTMSEGSTIDSLL
jgi:hypothetical protein